MPDAYDWNNVVGFLGGFGKKRAEIATQNQAAKEYKLQTVQTLFTFAEGKRASAEASRLLAGDEKLSRNERDRHALDAERHSVAGESIYAGASELFGMIDEKPKTGKKENPAMQFLQFVNPFKRRGNQPGEFEEELSTLLSSLGGGKGGGAGGESPGFTLGGIGGAPPQGQGAGDPEQTATSAALGAAIPGTGPTPRLPSATGQVSPAAAILAQQQQPVGPPFTTSPVAGAGGEALQAGVAPVAGITPTPAGGDPLDRLTRASELYPHITGTRKAYQDMNLADYEQNIKQEGQQAFLNLSTYLQSTPIRETFADAMNDPNFTKHYRPASSVAQATDSYDTFQSEIAAIFPEMRERPPQAGYALAADAARQLRLESHAGKSGDQSTFTDETILKLDTFATWSAMQPSLSPEMGQLSRYIHVLRKDPDKLTEQDLREMTTMADLLKNNIFGTQGTGAAKRYDFFKGMYQGAEVWLYRDPENPRAGSLPLSGPNGLPITTAGPLDLEDIMYTAEWTLNPETGDMQRKSWKVELRKVIAALSIPGSRRQIQAWLTTQVFESGSTVQRDVQRYLDDNPNAGLDLGELAPGPGNPTPGPGANALDAFRNRQRDRGRGPGADGGGDEVYVPPPSPF